jgi:hypothetical protein
MTTIPVPPDRLEVAREMNKLYNDFSEGPEKHKENFQTILGKCAEHGISLDLIQMSIDVFEMVSSRPSVKEYFV